MTSYGPTTDVPPLVRQAMDLAGRKGFDRSCAFEVGRLLHVLTARVAAGVIGEIGTGCGVGAAWVASALAPGVSFVTVEVDAERAAAAGALLSTVPNVRVIHGDWRELLDDGPFAMLFADVAEAKAREPELLLRALAPGGLVVLDDLTPEDQWPPDRWVRPDPVRDFWLNTPHVAATELLVTPNHAVILATRIA